ncbi:hypothetical protein QCN27_13920 [Cereibacter sp. SYSU M97828]|nr:hypothetical protein [Cereibacter flavus]
MKTMQDAIDHFVKNIVFSANYDRKIRGSGRKLARISNMPLASLSCDVAIFESRWPKDPPIGILSQWSSMKSYQVWRKQCIAMMKGYLACIDPVDPAGYDDDWTKVNAKADEIYGVFRAIAVKSLARESRKRKLQPGDLDGQHLVSMTRGCERATTARTLITGWRRLEAMADELDCPTPASYDFDALRRRNVAWRIPAPEDLASARDDWVAKKRSGFLGIDDISGDGVTDETAYGIADAINYFYTAGVTLHPERSEHSGLDVVCDVDLIVGVIRAEVAGALPWKKLAPVTVLSRLRFLTAFLEEKGLDSVKLKRLRDLPNSSYFDSRKQMSASRQAWCHALMLRPDMKETYLNLPGTLWETAKSKLALYDTAGTHDRYRITNWGTAACLSAVWRHLPLRIKSTENLTLNGAAPDIWFRGRSVFISTRAMVVKNDYEHHNIELKATSGADPAAIIRWYRDKIRPLLLRDDNHCNDPDLLFCGMNKQRLRRIWNKSSRSQNIPMTPHVNRHAHATLLLNDAELDMKVIAAHLGISEEVAERNYAFIDESRRHKAAQGALASLSRRNT